MHPLGRQLRGPDGLAHRLGSAEEANGRLRPAWGRRQGDPLQGADGLLEPDRAGQGQALGEGAGRRGGVPLEQRQLAQGVQGPGPGEVADLGGQAQALLQEEVRRPVLPAQRGQTPQVAQGEGDVTRAPRARRMARASSCKARAWP